MPCVVGVSNIRFVPSKKQLILADGRILEEGEVGTVDGTSGQVALTVDGQPVEGKIVPLASPGSYVQVVVTLG